MVQMKNAIALMGSLGLAAGAYAVPVTDWVQIIDVQTPSTGVTDANTASPIMGDADGATLAANFSAETIADGEFIKLSGSVSFDADLQGTQFRWGLFDGDNPVVVDEGDGYVGINAAAADSNGANGYVGFGDGSATNPFAGGATTQLDLFPAIDVDVLADETLDFELTIARDGANLDIFASITNNDTFTQSLDLQDQALTQYTYNTVAFLVGGSMNGTVSTFMDIDVVTGDVLLGDTDMDGDIDDSDLGTSFANYTGPVGAAGGKTAAQGDTDGDGDVDDSDLGTSFAGYTGPLGPAAVPEPTSLALLGLGGLLAIRRRRA